MQLTRSSGILLHPTSLPGPYGIGELGESAYRFVEFLAESGQRWWQVMPLGPTGYGDSPYQSFSTFAGNPLLLALDWLGADGLLPEGALDTVPDFSAEQVDYGAVQGWKRELFTGIGARFEAAATDADLEAIGRFRSSHGGWIYDFSRFMALKNHFNAPWTSWPAAVRDREPDALRQMDDELSAAIADEQVLQFQFFKQWASLKQYAAGKGVGLIGDVPIFVALDSADVWAYRQFFQLDEQGQPTVVAGVPPDYFSADGQRWGNPLYRWDRLAETGFGWWLDRLAASFERFDMLRLDHFRGFEAYWEIPAAAPTAVDGRWVAGPGDALFAAVRERLGDRPIIAENLGLITDEVEALRKRWGFPGMRVLQFAFDEDPTNPHLPHNHTVDSAVYTGTHDNDTTRGWWDTADEHIRHETLRYMGRHHLPPLRIVPQMIRLAMRSVSALTVIPLQDILNLDSRARMNRPGDAVGNWAWRFPHRALTGHLSRWLTDMTALYGRSRPE